MSWRPPHPQHARAQAQHDLTQSLSQIFERGAGSDEVMALRVFQALEGVAADPKTRQLLPGETITLMNNLHNWLLPGDANKAAASGWLPARTRGTATVRPQYSSRFLPSRRRSPTSARPFRRTGITQP